MGLTKVARLFLYIKGTGFITSLAPSVIEQLPPSAEASPLERLGAFIESIIAPLGYEMIHIEVQTHRQKLLRIFFDQSVESLARPAAIIDGLDPSESFFTASGKRRPSVSIEDCVRVTHALDLPLESAAEIDAIFHGASYELEVSSPGVDRPLRHARDYLRFQGDQARIHLYRPLTAEESGATEYTRRHPKQKSYLGILSGVHAGALVLRVLPDTGEKGQRPRRTAAKTSGPEISPLVQIPFALIAKANLEPQFDFTDTDESE